MHHSYTLHLHDTFGYNMVAIKYQYQALEH